MDEILPGVWHWTAEHPRIGSRVSSYYLEDAGVALDPMLPEGGIDAFGDWPVQRVVLTCRHHLRDAARLREAFGSTIHAARAGLHEFEGAAVDVEPYDAGDEIAPGVRVHELAAICPDDMVLHVHAGLGALAFGDGVVSHGGRPAFVPDALMDGPEQVKAQTFERLRDLLELDFDALLFAHGEPIPSGGRDALTDFLRSGS
jgi:hypothetical protein